MHKLALIGATLFGAAVLSAAPISVKWSSEKWFSVPEDKALAMVGRLATPGSVAGVHGAQTLRAGRRCAAGVTC